MTRKLIFSALVGGMVASTAFAQASTGVATGPRWSALVGCWEPAVPQTKTVVAAPTKVCVVPTGRDGADILSVAGGKVTQTMHVESDAAHHTLTQDGCTGWESASWSRDGRRLFLQSEQACGAVARKTTGLMGLSRTGRFLNVTNVKAGETQTVRVQQLEPFALNETIPSDVALSVADSSVARATARMVSRSKVTVDNVIEASKSVDVGAMEAWLTAQDQTFSLDARVLTRLADGGVDPGVIDVMVAASNPQVFAVAANEASGATLSEVGSSPSSVDASNNCTRAMIDPWGRMDYYPCDGIGYNGLNSYGYGRYGYGYGYDPIYGYNVYGAGYGYGYTGRPLVVYVRGSASDPAVQAAHGRMTKDGYVPDNAATSGSATTTRTSAPATTSTTSSGSTSSGGSSGAGSSSGGSSSGATSSGRTATRKPPTA